VNILIFLVSFQIDSFRASLIIYWTTSTCGSFERGTHGAKSHSGSYDNNPNYAAKNAAELEIESRFSSGYGNKTENIKHKRRNWLYNDFKGRMTVPTHCTIRTGAESPGKYIV
jgi:hypothetical protein